MDYIQAARFHSRCRSKGISAPPSDLLICAVAARLGTPIFTTDRDFERYAGQLPIALYRR